MLLAMTIVMLEVITFGFQCIVVFIFNFPPTAPGGDDLDDILIVNREIRDKGILLEDVTRFIRGGQFTPIDHQGLIVVA